MPQNRNASKHKSVPTSSKTGSAENQAQVVEHIGEFDEFGAKSEQFPPGDPRWEQHCRSRRLREAIGEAGGGKFVSSVSGVPYGTLNAYVAGGEMKVGTLLALASACNVRIEWIISGTGPMRPGQEERTPDQAYNYALKPAEPADFSPADDWRSPPADERALRWGIEFVEKTVGMDAPPGKRAEAAYFAAQELRRLQNVPFFAPLNPERLGHALEAAERMLAATTPNASPALRMHIAIGLYHLVETGIEAEAAALAENEEKPSS